MFGTIIGNIEYALKEIPEDFADTMKAFYSKFVKD